MKSFFVAFILFLNTFIFSQSFVNQAEEKVEANRRKLSNIKSCAKLEFFYSFGKINNSGEMLEFCEYNEDGFYTFKKIYDEDMINSYEVCEYDDQNNMIMFSEFDSFNNLVYKRSNRYENNIHLESVNFDKNGNYHFKEIYRYDSQNNWIGKDVFSWDGNLYYKHVYKYEKSKIVEQDFYDTLGNVHQKIVYEYINNRKSKELHYDKEGQIFEETSFKYPAKNKLLVETNFYLLDLSPEPVKTNVTKIYNDKDLIIEEYSEKENRIINWRKIYKYDKNGNILEIINHNSLDEPVSSIMYKYEYFPN